ncbi:hypothetical protein EUGRSUZ_L00836 [Eucalyptus grandis]|uniref:GDSL esterase/lipase 1-like n=3 Tax=Eucalyptus grandis TaxID=71139 RepID=A0AAD9TCF6_EUCGR|nr:hypothetical protein EUGRSUZ_L00836 [Eucalyptus grandis]
MSTPNIHILSFTIFARLLLSTLCNIDQTQNDIALFIFGDILNDAETNNYINTTAFFKANFSPYGETFFHYPTFIAEYAKLPLIPPYLQLRNDQFVGGANFASAGAGALPETFPGLVVDLRTQQKQFEKLVKDLRKKLGDEKAKRMVSEGVYMNGKSACCNSGLYQGTYSYGGMRGVREYSLCPNPEEYVFFDSYHPSERAYQQFGQLMWNGSWHTT